ncbi:MAG: L-threonylcarbamoyladenylate synthase [Fimbriimonadaceae bacterium]|nr:L-threonylcarbamoyladenylate synthase [Fimbriimonadaceae bacterium]
MSILAPTPEAIQSAAREIREGGVVVMPTETVYGLACDALNELAVRRVYDIKGRPKENPLIVHLKGWEDLGKVAEEWSPTAEKLAKSFWPGPLTLVLPKKLSVPNITTGGLETVAVRVPKHHVALELIRQAGCPLAAPSANVFMGLSPTRAEDIDPMIDVEVDIILDGGPCEYGVESTVLDVTDDHVMVLRPGAISRAAIQAILGRPLGVTPPSSLRRSPGQHRRHYAPRAKVVLVERVGQDPGLTFSAAVHDEQVKMPRDPHAYGAALYSALRRLDQLGVEVISIESPPTTPEWETVHDRLKRASTPA